MTAVLACMAAGRSGNYAVFDGTTDYFTRGTLSGASDNKLLTVSCWVKPTDFTINRYLFSSYNSPNGFFQLQINTGGKVVASVSDSTGIILSHTNTTALTVGVASHFMMSFDMSDTAKRHFYLDDISDINLGSLTHNDRNLPYSLTTSSAVGSNFDAANKTKAEVYDLYVHNAYIDLSIEANRRKFYSATGQPAALGAAGSIPTGTQPLIYFNGYGTFFNTGSAGVFTQNGTLTQGAGI